jgi:hypothetical protein
VLHITILGCIRDPFMEVDTHLQTQQIKNMGILKTVAELVSGTEIF